jgi:hypothetical protein
MMTAVRHVTSGVGLKSFRPLDSCWIEYTIDRVYSK